MWLKNFCGYNIFAPFCLTSFLIFELLSVSPPLSLSLPSCLFSVHISHPICVLFALFFVIWQRNCLRCLVYPSAWPNICAAYHAQELINFGILNCCQSIPPPTLPLLPKSVYTVRQAGKKAKELTEDGKRLNNNIVASFLLGKQKCLEKYVLRAMKSWA